MVDTTDVTTVLNQDDAL